MNNSVYNINKGINKPVEFRGLKAQYIWYLGGGLVALLIIFAVLYICGVNIFFCLALIVALATFLFVFVYKLSREYGQFGLMKKIARKGVPVIIKNYSLRVIKKQLHEKSA
jgi:Flp pilus assembly protein TadB